MTLFLIGLAVWVPLLTYDRATANRYIDAASFKTGAVAVIVNRSTLSWKFWRTPRADIDVTVQGLTVAGYFGADAEQVRTYCTAVRHVGRSAS